MCELHKPVLPEVVLAALAPKRGGLYLDGTLGLGGHAEAILNQEPESRICGLDRDGKALEMARIRLAPYGNRVNYFHLPFSEFPHALEALRWPYVDGALLDLGVSSMQLDNGERGFSFSRNGKLDMRMDQEDGNKTARDIVNNCSFDELREFLAVYGEEPLAARIARRIVERRKKQPIECTGELAELVCQVYPPEWRRKSRRHPATRAFQALRIAVNDELAQLRIFLDKIMAWLPVGGRLVVISFHSLEDRIVKRAMRSWAAKIMHGTQVGPCAAVLYKKPVVAGEAELIANPRAGSARLRAVEKIAACVDNERMPDTCHDY